MFSTYRNKCKKPICSGVMYKTLILRLIKNQLKSSIKMYQQIWKNNLQSQVSQNRLSMSKLWKYFYLSKGCIELTPKNQNKFYFRRKPWNPKTKNYTSRCKPWAKSLNNLASNSTKQAAPPRNANTSCPLPLSTKFRKRNLKCNPQKTY